jgi:hypothetical protein
VIERAGRRGRRGGPRGGGGRRGGGERGGLDDSRIAQQRWSRQRSTEPRQQPIRFSSSAARWRAAPSGASTGSPSRTTSRSLFAPRVHVMHLLGNDLVRKQSPAAARVAKVVAEIGLREEGVYAVRAGLVGQRPGTPIVGLTKQSTRRNSSITSLVI